MRVHVVTICHRTLVATILMGEVSRTRVLQKRIPTVAGYMLHFDLHDGSPIFTVLETIDKNPVRSYEHIPL